jgi:phosphoglycerate kinase
MEAGAKVLCASHLGKPKGKVKGDLSLAPVAAAFAETLGRSVRFVENCVGAEAEKAAAALEPGEVLLLENLRFHAGEEANDPEFAKGLAKLADCYRDDASGAAHRVSSLFGLPGILSESPRTLLEGSAGSMQPSSPSARSRRSSAARRSPEDRVPGPGEGADILLIGGGMANHFVRALGLPVGRSLLEEDKVAVAREILDLCKREGKTIALPSDFVVARSPDDGAGARTVGIAKIPADAMALDVGQKTLEQFERLLDPARTIFWNGPMGVFEKPPFDRATKALAMLLAESDAVTVVGGGESVAAVKGAGVAENSRTSRRAAAPAGVHRQRNAAEDQALK